MAEASPRAARKRVPLVASWNFAAGDGAAQPDYITITGTKGTLRVTAMDCAAPLRLDLQDGGMAAVAAAAAQGVPVAQLEFAAPEHVGQPLEQTPDTLAVCGEG